jgi:tetratricopeptide (TPR) repeat protein
MKKESSPFLKKRTKKLLSLAVICTVAAAPKDRATPLLDQLQGARTEQQAEALEQQISQTWQAAISPSVQLLTGRAMMSLAHQDNRTAIGDLDAALDLQPEQAILWRLHAEARFANNDTSGAYADLAQALAREPRCFQALVDLSHFAEAKKDYKRALDAWMALLALDPKTPHAATRRAILEQHVAGQAL